MKPVVVLSSDDAEFCLLLQYILEAEGYAICLANLPDEVVRIARLGTTRAILLDYSPESREAIIICRALKEVVETLELDVTVREQAAFELIHIDPSVVHVARSVAGPDSIPAVAVADDLNRVGIAKNRQTGRLSVRQRLQWCLPLWMPHPTASAWGIANAS
jgi:hypothetical protein